MSGEGPRNDCSGNGEYADDERICRRAHVDDSWIDALQKSTRQRQPALLGVVSVRGELGLEDDTLVAATFTETTEADTSGHHEVCADDGNSNANDTLAMNFMQEWVACHLLKNVMMFELKMLNAQLHRGPCVMQL